MRPQIEPEGHITTITHERAIRDRADGPLAALWAEITGNCQLSCVHCYAGSGPNGTHGTMAPEDWERVITEGAGLGTRFVCFIGGEPTMHPAPHRLVRHALGLGMEAEVYSNLVHVGPALWELFETPGVRLATSWYTNDRLEHKQITGRDTFRQALANIEEAVRREISLRVGLITGILPGQHAAEGEELLRARGVDNVGTDHLPRVRARDHPRPFAGVRELRSPSRSCSPGGSVTPCPLTRWMTAGTVLGTPLADSLGTVMELAFTLPAWGRKRAPDNGSCKPTCIPDSYCNPLCSPGACKPRI